MLEELKKKVFSERPILGQIYEAEKNTSLFEYAKKIYGYGSSVSKDRSEELITTLISLTEPFIGNTDAKVFAEEILTTGYVSAVDHHGPVSHPSFFDGNIVQSLVNESMGKKYVPIFSTASVSLDNHTFPRGFVFHEGDKEQRLSFFTDKYKHYSVYGTPAYTKKRQLDLKKIKMPIVFKNIFEQVAFDPKLFSFSKYRNQITYSNYLLWQHVHPKTKLIMLPIESITSKLLIDFHLGKNTPLDRLCTDQKFVELFSELFDGIPSAFATKENRGTFLFWGLEDGKRVRLSKKEMTLIREDGSVFVMLEPNALIEALRIEKIMPSLALCLITLGSYYGLVLGGGYSQVDYLPRIYDALKKLSEKTNTVDSFVYPYGSHFGSDFLFLMLRTKNDILIPATTLDYLRYKKETTASDLEKLIHTVTIGTAIESVLPDIYAILTHTKPIYESHVEPLLFE